MKKAAALALLAATIFSQSSALALPAQAAVSNWQKGANITPTSPTDFGSSSFDQSLQNLKNTGANAVALVIPYYQSNTGSTDIQAGYNTPTDAALENAIDYAHSLGMMVTLKLYDDPYTGDWRAYINPSDRTGWFNNYGAVLVHVGQIAQAHHVEMIVIGTEMVSMASSAENSTNTQNWLNLISQVRAVYSGKLTYEANSTNNNNDPFENEKATIGFWSALDYAGLSAYYDLNTSSNNVQSLETQWDYWNNNDLKQFAQQVGKPLLFLEVGYLSSSNSHLEPWNYAYSNSYDPTEQANDYQALMSYWNDYSYMGGVYWWYWQSNPNAGGSGDTSYTPQNKPAQQVMTQWFTTPSSPGTGSMPALTSNASTNPASPAQGNVVTITANVQNNGAPLQNAIIDIELYNQSGTRAFQQFFTGQSIANNQTGTYTVQWTAGAPGTYNIAVGVFNNDWSQNYSWNGNAGQVITVASAPSTPPMGPSGGSYTTNIWWPTNGATVSGVQPFKAMLNNDDVSQYHMYWQVDGGALNEMSNNSTTYPHKEADVDLSQWKWNSNHQYKINFVSKDNSGTIISQQSAVITVVN